MDTPTTPAIAWVVVADEAIARILARSPGGDALQPVEELTDAAAHADEADLRRDAHGRRAAPSGAGAHAGQGSITTSAADDALHREARLFARRVAAFLDEALQRRRYVTLHLFAAPRFLGLLRQALSPAVAAVVSGTSNKDLVHAPDADIVRRLQAEK